MRKPKSIIYGTDDKPPLQVLLVSALQQMSFLGVYLTVSPLFAREMGLDHLQSLQIMSATLVASAIGVALQASGKFGVGSGFFCPLQTTSSTFALLLLAKINDGLSSVFGTVFIVGLAQMGFAYVFYRLRSVFTVQVAGLSILLIGLGLGFYGVKQVLQAEPGVSLSLWHQLALCALTLGAMIVLNVWGTGYQRLFSAFLGLLVGFIGSWLSDAIPVENWQQFNATPLFYLPQPMHIGWQVGAQELLPAIITGMFLALHGFGALVAAQRFNDEDWKRPDLQAVKKGVLAEGLSNILSSLLNGIPVTSSGGAVSLAASTGCTSRYLAYWLAGIMIVIAFMPKAILFWQILPLPVMGAALIFLASFTALSGLQVIASRLLDNRKILAIGIALILGLSYEQLSRHFHDLSADGLKNLLFSGVSMGTFAAVVLSALFQIKNHTRERRSFLAQYSSMQDIAVFLEEQGKMWGAWHDLVHKAQHATWQALEIIIEHDLLDESAAQHDTIELQTVFNEFSFTVILTYAGKSLSLETHPPSHEEMLEDDNAVLRMAGYLMHRLADRVRIRRDRELCELQLLFNN